MPSPFPGIDPYLEACGFEGDFQIPFLVYCKEMIYESISEDYGAFIEHREMPMDPTYFEPVPDRFLEIEFRSSDAIVTTIELLDPANRNSERREWFLAWRKRQRAQKVNLVEIDLFRSGEIASRSESAAYGDYFAAITRANSEHAGAVFAWSIRDPLPKIPIPLHGNEEELLLDLNALYQRIYERSYVGLRMKYTADPPSFLRPEDQEWARGIVAKPA